MTDFPWPAPGWPDKGEKVRFINQNGYDYELSYAREHMDEGHILTIKSVQIGDWRTFYEFEELPGKFYNSVMFVRLSEEVAQVEPKPFVHKLVHGNKDMIELLEDALQRAKRGTLEGLIIIGCENGGSGWTGAFRDDMAFPWPRLQAAVDTAQHELLKDGVANWNG